MNWLKNMLGKKSSPPVKSGTSLLREADNLFVMRTTGVISKSTVDQVQAVAARDIDKGAENLKVLVMLDNFLGWKKGDDWGDLNFYSMYEKNIFCIAVVGDFKWETDFMFFLAVGYRIGEVKFFSLDQEADARAWLQA